MATTKQAMMASEHVDGLDVNIFYMDIRAFGKDFDQYYERAKARTTSITSKACPRESWRCPGPRTLGSGISMTALARERRIRSGGAGCGHGPQTNGFGSHLPAGHWPQRIRILRYRPVHPLQRPGRACLLPALFRNPRISPRPSPRPARQRPCPWNFSPEARNPVVTRNSIPWNTTSRTKNRESACLSVIAESISPPPWMWKR